MKKEYYHPGMKLVCKVDFGFGCPNKGDTVFVRHVKIYPDGTYGIDVVGKYQAGKPQPTAYYHNPNNFHNA